MKKYILIMAVAAAFTTACKDPQQDKSVIQQRDSLITVIEEREAAVNEFISAFNEVENNLDSVSKKQNLILLSADRDMKENQKEHINSEILAINELMDANNKKLKQLNKKLDKSDKKNVQLKKTIELLNHQLNEKYAELIALNERIEGLNIHVAQLETCIDVLNAVNTEQAQTLSATTVDLRTAYYIVGEAKELREAKLIDKKGGVLGIGRTSKLADELDNSLFTKIDYTQTTTIPVNSKNAKIITSHPEDSYVINKTGKVVTDISIVNPEKFWSASKYLVITK